MDGPAAYDPFDPAFVASPYAAYERLRARGAVVHDERTGQWLVPRHAHVAALLRDRRLGRSYLHLATNAEMGRPDDPPELGDFWRLIRDGMLDREPPDHTRLRRLVSKAFTPARVQALAPRVRAVAAGLVEDLAAAGGGDLIAAVAEPLPVTVIAELLGVPGSDRHLLRPWSADIVAMYELEQTPAGRERAVTAAQEFAAYLHDLARRRRADPRDDLVSALVRVVDESDGPERLTEDELVGTCVLLLNAGHEATVNVTGNGWWSLFRHPDQLARLRADPSLVPAAVEELMRFDTPLQLFERWVLEDVEIGGVTVRRGQELALLFGSANRDPDVFDRPDALDVGRTPNPHLSFGAGIHFCLGAPLARLELIASFEAVLARLPALELVREPAWQPGYVIRGLESLDVRA